MKKLFAVSLVLACGLPALAHAEQITCESKDGRENRCRIDARDGVHVVRNLSSTRCIEGKNWGIDRDAVWVDGGCRAVFASGGSNTSAGGSSGNLPNQVTCESHDNRRAECRMNTSGNVRMTQRLSQLGCNEGQDWGVGRDSVWVSNGCRARFENVGGGSHSGGGSTSSLPNRVTCESRDNRQVECDMDTRGEVRLTRRLSDSGCNEGQDWGVNKHSVWVRNGCRATFESAGTGPVYDNDPEYGGRDSRDSGPPARLVAACNAVEDNYGRVSSASPLKPGAWEIILDYDDGQYVCNVEGNGKVTYFEKLRR